MWEGIGELVPALGRDGRPGNTTQNDLTITEGTPSDCTDRLNSERHVHEGAQSHWLDLIQVPLFSPAPSFPLYSSPAIESKGPGAIYRRSNKHNVRLSSAIRAIDAQFIMGSKHLV